MKNLPEGYVVIDREKPQVGDLIIPADGMDYVGMVTSVDADNALWA